MSSVVVVEAVFFGRFLELDALTMDMYTQYIGPCFSSLNLESVTARVRVG